MPCRAWTCPTERRAGTGPVSPRSFLTGHVRKARADEGRHFTVRVAESRWVVRALALVFFLRKMNGAMVAAFSEGRSLPNCKEGKTQLVNSFRCVFPGLGKQELGPPVPHAGTEVSVLPRATQDRQLLSRAGHVRRGTAWFPGLGAGAEGVTGTFRTRSGEQL